MWPTDQAKRLIRKGTKVQNKKTARSSIEPLTFSPDTGAWPERATCKGSIELLVQQNFIKTF